MISHKHQCIFVEIPKTASTSVREVIGKPHRAHLNIWQIKYAMENEWTRYGGIGNKIIRSMYHWVPEKLRRERGRQQFRRYYKFSFVRNPWDRVVSLYLRREGLQMRNRMNFEEFADWIKYSSSTCKFPMPHTNQIDWLVNPSGRILVDFIGKYENLEQDWKTCAGRIGLPAELPHVNKNPRQKRHYTEYYTDATRKIIADKFRVDIDFFDYKFGE